MKTICQKAYCTGCAACVNACAMSCITMYADEEGFLRPQIDSGKCVGCGHCEKVCPINKPHESREPLSVYAAMATDLKTRIASSSGGIFTLLARQIIEKRGVVYGVAWDVSNYGAKFMAARTEDELAELRGSKCVQAEVGKVYNDVRVSLETGKPVLFSGTPCQIAALLSFLGRGYDNLLTVEVICHAAPSPLAFRRYLEEREQIAGDKVQRISCRTKNPSWTRYSLSIEFRSGGEYIKPAYRDAWLRGFVSDLYNRPSCTQCQFKNLRSGADLTIGDYWGIKKSLPAMYDDRGTSAVILNTSKGVLAFDEVKRYLNFCQSTIQDVVRYNPALVRSSSASKHRAWFFARISMVQSFGQLTLSLSRLSIRSWLLICLGSIKRRVFK